MRVRSNSLTDLGVKYFFFQAEDGIRDIGVTGVQTCALPISAVGKGVVVVPTTAGWLVGVDRMSRAVLWAHRYFPPDPNGRVQENGFGFPGGYEIGRASCRERV